MTGEERRARILEIIHGREIGTQQELVEALNTEGYKAAQATISRDVHCLRLHKERTCDGRRIYRPPCRPPEEDEALCRTFRDSVLSVRRAGNLIVIKTVNAAAGTVAAAIDSLNPPEVAGTVAGDDTLFVALVSDAAAGVLHRRFAGMVDADGS